MDALHKAFLEFQVILTEDGKTYEFDTREELKNTSLTFQEHLDECAEILFPITDDMSKEKQNLKKKQRIKFERKNLKLLRRWRKRKMKTKGFQPFDWFDKTNLPSTDVKVMEETYNNKVVKPYIKFLENEEERRLERKKINEQFSVVFEALKEEFNDKEGYKKRLALARKAKGKYGSGPKGFMAFVFSFIRKSGVVLLWAYTFYLFRIVFFGSTKYTRCSSKQNLRTNHF